MKVKQSVKLTLTGIASKGMAVGRTTAGVVVFVKDAVPGDVAMVYLYKKRKSYFEGRLEKLISPSPDRISAKCSHFGVCGGCQWQHLSYPSQLKHKQEEVHQNFIKIGSLDFPKFESIIPSRSQYNYRNKMEYSFSNSRWLTKAEIESGKAMNRNALGFHKPRMWDKIVHIEECHLQQEPGNEIRNFIHQYALDKGITYFDLKQKTGQLRSMMIRTTTTGQIMLVIQFFEDQVSQRVALFEAIVERFPQVTSLQYIVNQKANDSIYDQDVILHSGSPYIEEEMEGLRFQITPKSFYQTNSLQAHELYKITRDFAGLTGDEIVYDLYTGLGTIAQFVAKRAKHVVGIEAIPEAIAAAKENAKRNKLSNLSFISGNMKKVFTDDFIATHGTPDVVITDPPREGMHKDVVKQLIAILPKRIVYVSCNSATQARDLSLMQDHYVIQKVQPVDMFPHTQHVENVVLLERVHA
jgi:23S rRNA (uracil1939-C5)-methyltransferase